MRTEPKVFRFSTVSKSQSLQSLSYVRLQRGWHARLGDDDQSAAVWAALLGFPDTSKGNPFGVDLEVPPGSAGRDLSQGVDENIPRRDPGSPED
jgi:hypothetical protein